MSVIRDIDWAYAAGFVDGEGCIAVTRSFVRRLDRYQYSVQIVVANNRREVLDWMQSLWGGWVVSVLSPLRGGLAKDSWTWRCPTGQRAQPFLEGIRPYLRLKQAQCDNAIHMCDLLKRSWRTLGPNKMPATWRAEQEIAYWRNRELNHRGNTEFVRKAMHSPRQIHRARLSIA